MSPMLEPHVPWSVALSMAGPVLRHAVGAALRALGLQVRMVAPAALATTRADVYLVGTRVLAMLQAVPRPTVVVLTGAAVPDACLPALTHTDVAVACGDPTPVSLLRAVLSALSCRGCEVFGAWAEPLPPLLRRAFLTRPAAMRSLCDVASVLGVSRDTARTILRDVDVGGMKFDDVRHLRTWMIAEYWADLARLGIPRKQVEAFLGIANRSDFRRACRRAGLEPPWRTRKPVPMTLSG